MMSNMVATRQANFFKIFRGTGRPSNLKMPVQVLSPLDPLANEVYLQAASTFNSFPLLSELKAFETRGRRGPTKHKKVVFDNQELTKIARIK